MRVTNRGMVNTYMNGMQNNLNEMQKLNNQMNTQKAINKVSDDPYNATKIMNMKTEIQDIERFNYNCDEMLGWVETTDVALDRIGTNITEIKTLLTSINDTFTQGEVDSVKKDITEKIKELAESLNSTYAGKFIFAGSQLSEKPADIKTNQNGMLQLEISNKIDDLKLKTEISNGMSIEYNANISNVLGNDGLDIVNNVITVLNKQPFDVKEIITVKEDLSKLQQNVLDCRSTIGSKAKTIESIKNNNDTNIEKASEIMSKVQDVDFAEKYIELMTAQLAYNASIQVGSNLFQSTILDFIK